MNQTTPNLIYSKDGYGADIHYTMVENQLGEEYCMFFAVPSELTKEEFHPGFYTREEAESWLSVKQSDGKAIYRLVANRGDLFEYRYFVVSSDFEDDLYQGEFIPGFISRTGAVNWWTNSIREFLTQPERKA